MKKRTQNAKEIVTKRMADAIEQMVDSGAGKNKKDICSKINLSYTNLPKYKDPTSGKHIGTDVIYNAVNELGLNPTAIFLKDGPKTQHLFMKGSIHFAGDIGDNNTVTNESNANKPIITGNHVVGNLTVVHTLENLINDVPAELRQKIQEHISIMTGEIAALKKMVDDHKKELVEKNQEINGVRAELVEAQKKAQENGDKLVKTLEQLSDAQEKYATMLEQSVKDNRNRK